MGHIWATDGTTRDHQREVYVGYGLPGEHNGKPVGNTWDKPVQHNGTHLANTMGHIWQQMGHVWALNGTQLGPFYVLQIINTLSKDRTTCE